MRVRHEKLRRTFMAQRIFMILKSCILYDKVWNREKKAVWICPFLMKKRSYRKRLKTVKSEDFFKGSP